MFSRHPFTATTELDFGVQRPTIITKLTLAGEEVVFVSAHFNPTYYALKQTPKPQRTQAIQQYILDQNSEAAQLITHLQTNHPDSIVVVGCDCNSYTTSSTNPILDSYLTDPVHTLGIPLNQSAPEGTSHEIRPRRIDYLWYRGDVKPIGIYRVKETAGSDHNPILAEFILD